MLSSVAHKTDAAAWSVEYPEDDGGRGPCPREYSLRPTVHFLPYQPGVVPRTVCRFRQRPGCELQLVKAYLTLEDGRGLTRSGSGQGHPSRISEIPA